MSNNITFGQFKRSFDKFKNAVDKVDKKDLNILWMDDYYDSMLLGMLEYQNNKFRFEIISDLTESEVPRIFAIIHLTPDQIEEEAKWNNLFKKFVGNHNNFDSDEELDQKPENMHHLFYDEYNKRITPDYESNIVKGWFIEE